MSKERTLAQEAIEFLEAAEDALVGALAEIDARSDVIDVGLGQALERVTVAKAIASYRAKSFELQEASSAQEPEYAPRPQGTYATFPPSTPPAYKQAADDADDEEHALQQGVAPQPQHTYRTYTLTPRKLEPKLDVETPGVETPDEPFSVVQLAADLTVSTTQVHRWIRAKQIQAERVKNSYRIPAGQVRMLRAIAATRPPDRKSNAAWINKVLSNSS